MITPKFHLSQDDGHLFVTIHAPFSRVSDAEIFMDGADFRFHSNPYYLRLNLPGEIVENDSAKADFDADTNEFKIVCPKVAKGTHFPGLDMLTSLLEPKGKRTVDTKSIEVVGDSSTCDLTESETDFDWFVEQRPAEEENKLPSSSSSYGFACKHSGLFSKLADELHQVVDVRNPDSRTLAERKSERLQQEAVEFNPEHYLGDLFHDECIEPLLSADPPKVDEEWSDGESNLLKNLSHKEFLLDHDTLQSTYLGLVDILLAYCYDMRCTVWDPTVESAWAISKISGTLSWLEHFTSIREVAVCFLRRSLCFPLYRNFKLSIKAVQDTGKLLKSGRKPVLRCFLQIYQLFNKSEPRYLLNQLYIQDYCVWLQNCNDDALTSLSDSLTAMKLTKDDVDLHLEDLERAAVNLMCHSDSSDGEESDVEERMARLSISQGSRANRGSGLPMDLRVAAEAARVDASDSDSSLDSDDLSSEESDE